MVGIKLRGAKYWHCERTEAIAGLIRMSVQMSDIELKKR